MYDDVTHTKPSRQHTNNYTVKWWSLTTGTDQYSQQAPADQYSWQQQVYQQQQEQQTLQQQQQQQHYDSSQYQQQQWPGYG